MQPAREFFEKLGPKLMISLVSGFGVSGALLLLFSELLLQIRIARPLPGMSPVTTASL